MQHDGRHVGMCGLCSQHFGRKSTKDGIVPMTQFLALSPLETIRRDRLNHLCDLYAEALDTVINIMNGIMAKQKAAEEALEYPEIVPEPLVN